VLLAAPQLAAAIGLTAARGLPQLNSKANLGPTNERGEFKASTSMALFTRFRWLDTRFFPVLLTTPARIDNEPENSSDNQDGYQYEDSSVTHDLLLVRLNEARRSQISRMDVWLRTQKAQRTDPNGIFRVLFRLEEAAGLGPEVARPMAK
jgi:hypothetical protein